MPRFSSHQKAILALILCNIIWGAASPIFKFSLQNIPPFSLALVRFGGAAFILLPLVHRELHSLVNEMKDWKKILIFSISGVTVNITFFFLALRLTHSINAPIIGSTGPIVLITFAALFLHERATWQKIFGALISFSGVLLIIIQPLLEKGLDVSLIGNLLLVGAMLGAVGQTIVGREIMHRYPPLPLTFWAFLIGTLTFIPMAIPELLNFPVLDVRGWTGIIFGVFFSSALAYSLYAWGLSKIEASEAGLFAYIDPVVALLLAYPLLGEKPTAYFALGSALVFVGIFIAENHLNWHPIRKLFSA